MIEFAFNIWFISDTHFFHENILQYEYRPFYCNKEMNAEMIEKWNSVIKPGHQVVFLGDLSFGSSQQTRELCQQLNGIKTMVCGNHDTRRTKTWWRREWPDLKQVYFRKDQPVQLKYKPLGQDYFMPEKILLSHIPIPLDEMDDTWLNIHGHIHGRTINDPRYLNVSAELLDYLPTQIDFKNRIYK